MTIYPNQKEIAYKYVFNLLNIGDMVLPHYWSNLFIAMQHLLSDEDIKELENLVRNVELMCGYRKTDDELEPIMTLYEIEIYLFNSYNLKSYFLVEGRKITQFEIEKKLFQVKEWCFNKVNKVSKDILFTKPPV